MSLTDTCTLSEAQLVKPKFKLVVLPMAYTRGGSNMERGATGSTPPIHIMAWNHVLTKTAIATKHQSGVLLAIYLPNLRSVFVPKDWANRWMMCIRGGYELEWVPLSVEIFLCTSFAYSTRFSWFISTYMHAVHGIDHEQTWSVNEQGLKTWWIWGLGWVIMIMHCLWSALG